MRRLNDLIQNMPLKREREAGIRSSLVSSSKTSKPNFRYLIQTIDSWKKMGLNQDPNEMLLPYYQDLTFNQIEDFWKKEIKGKTMQIVVVGNSKKFDIKVLEKYGTLIKVNKKQVVKN